MNGQLLPKLLILGSIFIVSCSSNSTSSNGGDDNNGELPPSPNPTFSNVQIIFSNSCGGSNCHIGERTNGVRLDGYTNVVESEGTRYGRKVIQPNDANGSPLVDKIEPNPQFGLRMPRNRSPLSSDEISLIREWIDAGAMDN